MGRRRSTSEFKMFDLTGHQGSLLWMAPEIMVGDNYNEKVDVYSYAMCMIELLDRHLPDPVRRELRGVLRG